MQCALRDLRGIIVKGVASDISLKWIKDVMPFVRAEDQQRWVEGFSFGGSEMST
jgi:hypothetical protein